MNCTMCNSKARLVKGNVIYPHRADLYKLNFWQCPECKSYVGCHKNSTEPLGTMADKQTKRARMIAHNVFDCWRKTLGIRRAEAYKELQLRMGMTPDEAHIGKMDIHQCRSVVKMFSTLDID